MHCHEGKEYIYRQKDIARITNKTNKQTNNKEKKGNVMVKHLLQKEALTE
jgi:hypothetical protein